MFVYIYVFCHNNDELFKCLSYVNKPLTYLHNSRYSIIYKSDTYYILQVTKLRYLSFNGQSKFVHEKALRMKKLYSLGVKSFCKNATQPYVSNPNLSNVMLSE